MATTKNQNSISAALSAVRTAGPGARVGVVGSRGFAPLSIVSEFVSLLPAGCIVVSGAARGVDSIAASSARKHGLKVIEFVADWSRGKSAGMERNIDIIKNSNVVVAFWDGSSKGTAHSIETARRAGVPVFVIRPSVAAGMPVQASLF